MQLDLGYGFYHANEAMVWNILMLFGLRWFSLWLEIGQKTLLSCTTTLSLQFKIR